MLGKHSRERSGEASQRQPKKKAQEERSKRIRESRMQWAASATVMWRTPWYASDIVIPGGETLRLLHVAVLCQWRVQLATEGDTQTQQGSGAGNSNLEGSEAAPATPSKAQRHYDMQWMHCTDDCAAASAMALHQLALLHRCHWEISLQESLGDIVFVEPHTAHWPIHCAIAARGCLLSDMLQC